MNRKKNNMKQYVDEVRKLFPTTTWVCRKSVSFQALIISVIQFNRRNTPTNFLKNKAYNVSVFHDTLMLS